MSKNTTLTPLNSFSLLAPLGNKRPFSNASIPPYDHHAIIPNQASGNQFMAITQGFSNDVYGNASTILRQRSMYFFKKKR